MNEIILSEPAHPRVGGKYNQYHGLLKIGAYHKSLRDHVRYVAGLPDGTCGVADIVYVASLFSYWEQYYLDTIRAYKFFHPSASIVFGGIYAINAYERVKEWEDSLGIAVHPKMNEAAEYAPDVGLIKTDFASLLTSRGCPNDCSYCSVDRVYGSGWRPRPVDEVLEEIKLQVSRGILKFALFDDNFLFRAEDHALPLLESIIRLRSSSRMYRRIKFGIPSGFQANHMTLEIAEKLRLAGFTERMSTSLETVDDDVLTMLGRHRKWSSGEHLAQCISYMVEAGYKSRDIMVYFICGLPYQSIESMLRTAVFIGSLGCFASMQRFAPIPGTLDFERCGLDVMTYDMALTEGRKFVASGDQFTGSDLREFRNFVRWMNVALVYSGVNMFRPQGSVMSHGMAIVQEMLA